ARDPMPVHELAEQCGVMLFLTDEELGDPHEVGGTAPLRKAPCGAEERATFGLLSELERGDGARNEPPLIVGQIVGKVLGRRATGLRVVLEMIQPDIQVREHASSSSRSAVRVEGHAPEGKGRRADAIVANCGAPLSCLNYLTISRSSTSKTSVAPGRISGGDPRDPYAASEGQMKRLLPPTFMCCSASVQQGITASSGNVTGSPRSTELSKTWPSISLPS